MANYVYITVGEVENKSSDYDALRAQYPNATIIRIDQDTGEQTVMSNE